MEDWDSKELLREEEREEDVDEQEEVTHEQEEYYANLVSGPYMHIFLENFRKEVQKSSSSKRRGKYKYKGVAGDGIEKEEEEEIIEPPMHEPPPTPLPADNLMSAMKKSGTTSASTSKGRRNTGKGRLLSKTVTWAPDVYDPHPSADSHYIDASGGYGSSTGRTQWNGGGEKKINKGKNWQQGDDKSDDGEGVKGSKNNVKKTSRKDGIEGGDTASETGIGRHNKSGSKKSQKNPQKGADSEARGGGGGAKRGKEKDKKTGGGGSRTGGDRGRGGGNDGKGKDKKLGKSKGAKA